MTYTPHKMGDHSDDFSDTRPCDCDRPAGMGDNLPSDPFTLIAESIEDLMLEANNFLDGKEIENEEQEEAVASILTRLRRERTAADEQRIVEKKPHDDAANAVQAKWKPLLQKADLAVSVAKNALTAFLVKKDAAQRAAAEALRLEAEEAARAAAQTAEQARPDDLAGQTTARIRQENAADLAKRAEKAGKVKVQAKGGERAVGLRSSWTAEVTDPIAFGRWAWEHRHEEYLEFLTGLAQRECRHGPKDIPGVKAHEERGAV